MEKLLQNKDGMSAGAASLLDEVGDRADFELKIVKADRKEFASKTEKGVINLAWQFSALVLESEDTKNLGETLKDKDGKEIWVNFMVFFGKKSPTESGVNFNYTKFRDIVLPNIDDIDKDTLKGSELLKKIKDHKNFLITLEAQEPYTSEKGVEYVKYAVRDIQDTMLPKAVIKTDIIAEDEVIGLWDE